MKNYLFIDSAEGTRVLLNINGARYYAQNLKNGGAETLMPTVDEVLSRAGAKLSDVDIFGASIGPGSFTGLRVGLTTVKAFCYSLDKPCFGVNNLRLNSYNNSSGKVVSVADAGSRVCYIAAFDGEDEVLKTKCVTLDDAKKIVSEYSGFAVSTDLKLAPVFNGTAGVGEKEMAVAAEKHMGDVISYKALVPLYIRKAQPERGEGDL